MIKAFTCNEKTRPPVAPICGIKFLAAFLYSVTCDVKTGKAVQTLQQLPGRHGRMAPATLSNKLLKNSVLWSIDTFVCRKYKKGTWQGSYSVRI